MLPNSSFEYGTLLLDAQVAAGCRLHFSWNLHVSLWDLRISRGTESVRFLNGKTSTILFFDEKIQQNSFWLISWLELGTNFWYVPHVHALTQTAESQKRRLRSFAFSNKFSLSGGMLQDQEYRPTILIMNRCPETLFEKKTRLFWR